MSIPLIRVAGVAVNLGIGVKPITRAVALCTPVVGSPRAVTVTVAWTDAPYSAGLANPNVAVEINLQDQQVNEIDGIRSVKIDNTFCDVPVYLQFFDTGDTVTCPPNSVIYAPVFTNGKKAILYGTGFFDGRSPETTVIFSNLDRQGLVIQGGVGTEVNSSLLDVSGAATATPANFNNQRLGAAYPGRLIVCTVLATRNAAAAAEPTNLTCNGVVMTKAVGNDVVVSGLGTNASASIWYGIVPTGTTGNIVITLPAGFNGGVLLSCHVVRNYSNPVPFSTGSDTQQSAEVVATASLDTVPGAAVIACAQDYNSPAVFTIPEWRGDVPLISWRFQTSASLNRGSYGAVDNFDRTGAASISTRANILASACWV